MTLMPRVNPYAALSASTVNTIAAEVEGLGRACRVRRTSAQNVPSGTRTALTWQAEDFDTNGGGMWSPQTTGYVTIQIAGTYLIIGQVRWDDLGGSGSIYRAGLRNNYITVNSTDPSGAACKGNVSVDASRSTNGEGSTVQVVAREALQPGDRVYLVVSQDCGSTIAGCHQNYGGTFLDVSRISGLT